MRLQTAELPDRILAEVRSRYREPDERAGLDYRELHHVNSVRRSPIRYCERDQIPRRETPKTGRNSAVICVLQVVAALYTHCSMPASLYLRRIGKTKSAKYRQPQTESLMQRRRL